MYCKDCKHWDRNKEVGENKKFGSCGSEKFEDNSNRGFYSKEFADDMFVYSDYESYAANFETGENFGCVHFEKKEAE
jgi:hypothetical protein